MKSAISLHGMELEVNLGWPETERSQPQWVSLDLHMHFPAPPSACYSDDLADTFCYDELSQKIKAALTNKNFKLIEHLGFTIYQLIKAELADGVNIQIQLTKKPAIAQLKDGVCFSYGDF